MELVYGSSFFKSIETGGNVSKALVSLSRPPALEWGTPLYSNVYNCVVFLWSGGHLCIAMYITVLHSSGVGDTFV